MQKITSDERRGCAGNILKKDKIDMAIGICDDVMQIAVNLQEQIMRLSKKNNIEEDLRIYLSGEALLEDIDNLDIVFLDIEMPGLDGIETGRQIRKIRPDCKIIMATGRIDRISEAFHFQAFRFVQKPFQNSEVEEALVSAFRKQPGEQYIEVFRERNVFKMQQKNICYIRAYNGYIELKAGDKFFRKDISLNELDKELDQRIFAHTHRQYIVNLQWVEKYMKYAVLVQGDSIPVSRRMKKEFERQYILYDVHYR